MELKCRCFQFQRGQFLSKGGENAKYFLFVFEGVKAGERQGRLFFSKVEKARKLKGNKTFPQLPLLPISASLPPSC